MILETTIEKKLNKTTIEKKLNKTTIDKNKNMNFFNTIFYLVASLLSLSIFEYVVQLNNLPQVLSFLYWMDKVYRFVACFFKSANL